MIVFAFLQIHVVLNWVVYYMLWFIFAIILYKAIIAGVTSVNHFYIVQVSD